MTVLITSLFKLFSMMLVEELLCKVMCVWGRLIFWCVDISWRLISIVDFKGFRFNKVCKRSGVKKVRREIFYAIKFII